MKNEFMKWTKTLFAVMALLMAITVFSSTAAFAAQHNGGHGFGGGGRSQVGHSYFGGRGYGSSFYGGGGGRYYGGRNYYAPRYYRGGFGLGFYAAPGYGYAAPVCSPSGFYDQSGYWHYYPGCAAPPPYGY